MRPPMPGLRLERSRRPRITRHYGTGPEASGKLLPSLPGPAPRGARGRDEYLAAGSRRNGGLGDIGADVGNGNP
jgi:hypothetical protein